MKKAILSLCVAVAAALAFIGCNKSSGGRSRVGGVNISDLGGHKFEKVDVMGRTTYVAKLDPKNGFAANVNVVAEESKGILPTMDEYLKMSMNQYDTLGAKMQVQGKTDSTVTISGTLGAAKIFQRVFRDEAKNSFVVVTGTYKDDSDKDVIESCVNGAEL